MVCALAMSAVMSRADVAGRDIEISVNIIIDVEDEPSARNIRRLAQRLKEGVPLDPLRSLTGILVDRLEKAIAELPEREREYLKRIEERCTQDKLYYVPLSGETVETSQTDSMSTWRHSARRRQRRAMADYCEWVPAQREMVRIKLSSLEEGVSKYACIILLGSPGSGKTTALEMISLQLARMGLGSDRDARGLLPVPLRLSEYEPGMSVEDFIIQGFSGSLAGDHWDAAALAANLHGYLNEGRMFFLFDALNEMPREGYSERVSQLRQFIDRWQSVGNRFIVSCRVLDYSEELQGLQRIEILPLDDVQIQRFVLTEITSASVESGTPAAASACSTSRLKIHWLSRSISTACGSSAGSDELGSLSDLALAGIRTGRSNQRWTLEIGAVSRSAHGRQIRMRGTFGWEQIEHEPVRHGHNHVVRRDRLAGTEDDPGRAAVCDRQVSDAGLQPYAGRALRQPARQPCPVERIERHGRNLDFPSVAVGEKPVDKDLPRAGDVDPLESLAQRADEHGRPKAIDGRLGLAMPGQPRGKMFVVRVSIERAWGGASARIPRPIANRSRTDR